MFRVVPGIPAVFGGLHGGRVWVCVAVVATARYRHCKPCRVRLAGVTCHGTRKPQQLQIMFWHVGSAPLGIHVKSTVPFQHFAAVLYLRTKSVDLSLALAWA